LNRPLKGVYAARIPYREDGAKISHRLRRSQFLAFSFRLSIRPAGLRFPKVPETSPRLVGENKNA
jgi:hypothetical protein